MTDNSFWSGVSIGYSPLVARDKQVMATRLTVFSHRNVFPAPDTSVLLAALAEEWPDGPPPLLLNVMSEGMLLQLFHSELPPTLMLEVPSFMAADEVHTDLVRRLAQRGHALVVKGRLASELPGSVAGAFKYSMLDLQDDIRARGEVPGSASAAPGMRGEVKFIQSGVQSIDDMDAAFKRGAAAVAGWPMDEAVSSGQKPNKLTMPPDLAVIAELISRTDKQEPIDRLEDTLRRDPTLAFKLLRYINSAAFGLRVEISSFRHAIMMLGYQRLKRWLALLLATASKDANQRPLMFAAVRRGLFLEELVRGTGDEEMRNELFICGVFSLLDRMFRQPFAELLQSIPVPERVSQALAEQAGPYHAHMELVRAVESESLFDLRSAAEALMLDSAEVNRALLRALARATQLE